MENLVRTTRSIARASLLACVVLLALAATASAAEAKFTEPTAGTEIVSQVGKAITPVKVKGEGLATLKAEAGAPLPAGLKLEKVEAGETEWTIVGTPTTAKAKSTVTLEATSEAKRATVSVEWTVEPEAAPKIGARPGPTVGRVGEALGPLAIKGTSLNKVTATPALPAGLELNQVGSSETEWAIHGTPTASESPTTVTLHAKNKEGAETTTTFELTIHEALPTITTAPEAKVVGRVGESIGTLVIKGTNLAEFFATPELPAGLKILPVGILEIEWAIRGTPTATAAPTTIALHAKNKAGEEALASPSFELEILEALATISRPADQTSTVGTAIAPLTVKGIDLKTLTAKGLPAGLSLAPVGESETEWTIAGTPTTAETSTVTLEAKNKEGTPGNVVTFQWTVSAPAVVTPSFPPGPAPMAPAPTIPSAGRLGTVPSQKLGKQLMASFLCEVASCKVQIVATITAGATKFKVHSARTAIAQSKKLQIPLKLTSKQQATVLAALKKHKKVTAALSATIQSSVGYQVTKALTVTVKR